MYMTALYLCYTIFVFVLFLCADAFVCRLVLLHEGGSHGSWIARFCLCLLSATHRRDGLVQLICSVAFWFVSLLDRFLLCSRCSRVAQGSEQINQNKVVLTMLCIILQTSKQTNKQGCHSHKTTASYNK